MPKAKKPDELVDAVFAIAEMLKALGNGSATRDRERGAIEHLSHSITESNEKIAEALHHIAEAISDLATSIDSSATKEQ